MTARSRLVLWAPVALLWVFEFWLSSQSKLPEVPGLTFPNADKVLHAGYYFGMALFAVRALRFGEGLSGRKTALVLLLGGAAAGALDEFHQSLVPGRDSTLGDVAADIAGALVAALVGGRIWRALRLDRVTR